MRPVAAPGRPSRGRWIWGLSGLVTAAALAVPGTRLIARAGTPMAGPPPLSAVPTRTITVPQRITSLDVESYGAQIQVTAGSVRHVRVTEAIMYGPPDAGPPAVTESVSHGRLTLAAPACGNSDCRVAFAVIVPADVAVTAQSDGGPVTVSGVAAATIDSGGGPVRATAIRGALTVSSENGPVWLSDVAGASVDSGGGLVGVTGVHGPLTVSTENGSLLVNGLSGPLDADTGGGSLLAQNVAAVTATVDTGNGDAQIDFTAAAEAVTVNTGGGNARIGFTVAPQTVSVSTEGGDALLTVPGGPYALTTDSGGGPELAGIPASPAARRSISVTSGGGAVRIEPAAARTGALRVSPPKPPALPEPPALPKPPAPPGSK
jgi:hypothetical protein